MASKQCNLPKACACKGIRSCLVCEKRNKSNNNEAIVQVYHFCRECHKAFCQKDHPNHQSDFIDIGGIFVTSEFVTLNEEEGLLLEVEQTQWVNSQSGRRKQDYGPKVNFKKQKVNTSCFSGLPSYSEFLVKRMLQIPSLANFQPVEMCCLDYDPSRGSSIDPHFDDFWLWGERLVTVNLLSATAYTLTRPSQPDIQVKIELPRRSIIVLSGESRHDWQHSIMREDVTCRRIGITFRELSDKFKDPTTDNGKLGQQLIETAFTFVGISVADFVQNTKDNKDTDSGGSHANDSANLASKGDLQTQADNQKEKSLVTKRIVHQGFERLSKNTPEADSNLLSTTEPNQQLQIEKPSYGLKLTYVRQFFSEPHADKLFQSLEQEITYMPAHLSRIKIFGAYHSIPRKQVAYGDHGLTYTFSGVTVPAKPWCATLLCIRELVQRICDCQFNFVLINRYSDGMDSIGFHRDDEKDLDPSAPIAALSLGAERLFVFRYASKLRKTDRKKESPKKETPSIPPVKLVLQPGSLLIMWPPTNKFWQHSLPKDTKCEQCRVSLTFRRIINHNS